MRGVAAGEAECCCKKGKLMGDDKNDAEDRMLSGEGPDNLKVRRYIEYRGATGMA